MAIPAADWVSAGCNNLQESQRDQSQTPPVWSCGLQWETVHPPPWETSVALDKSRTFQRVCEGKWGGGGGGRARRNVLLLKSLGSDTHRKLLWSEIWLSSTLLTKHFSQSLYMLLLMDASSKPALKNLHLLNGHFQVPIPPHAAPLGQRSSTVQLTRFP